MLEGRRSVDEADRLGGKAVVECGGYDLNAPVLSSTTGGWRVHRRNGQWWFLWKGEANQISAELHSVVDVSLLFKTLFYTRG